MDVVIRTTTDTWVTRVEVDDDATPGSGAERVSNAIRSGQVVEVRPAEATADPRSAQRAPAQLAVFNPAHVVAVTERPVRRQSGPRGLGPR